MKNKLLIIVLASLLFPFLGKAKATSNDTISARRAFIEFDIDMLDLINKDLRLAMLNYYDIDSIPEFGNDFSGATRLRKLTPDFLDLQVSESSSMQLKVLPLKNGSQILVSVYTVGEPGDLMESEIKFFDSNLKPLDSKKFFTEPPLSAFFSFPTGNKTTMKDIEQALPFSSIYYTLSADNNNIVGKLTIPDSMNVEDKKLVETLMRPQIIMNWDGNKFSKNK